MKNNRFFAQFKKNFCTVHLFSHGGTGFVPGIVVLLLFEALYLHGAEANKGDITSLLARARYDTGDVGVVVHDITNDTRVAAFHADTPRNPASVQKLTTAAVALDLLGPSHVFQTEVFIDNTFDMDSGLLSGNLYIRGSGDPGFLVERLWLFVQHLRHTGLRRIEGNCILDNTCFDTTVSGPGYGNESSSRAYAAPVGALSASFNSIAIHVRPGGRPSLPVNVDLFPRLDDISLQVAARTTNGKKSPHLTITTGQETPGHTAVTVAGSMPVHAEAIVRYRKIWNPTDHFGRVFTTMMKESGMVVKGKIVSGKTPDSLTCAEPFCTYQSQPLSDFIGYMFKYSNNFAAEMLFKSFSIGRDTLAGTWDGSSCVVAEWWKERIGETTPTVRNGSGMGDVNRISPMQVVDLLKWVYHTKTIYPEFLSSLSTSGIDGTLKSRFLHSPLRGIIRAKTGTLNMYGVSTLAGYVLLPEKTLAFALLFNNAGSNQYRHWIMQKEILEHVVTRIQDTAG